MEFERETIVVNGRNFVWCASSCDFGLFWGVEIDDGNLVGWWG